MKIGNVLDPAANPGTAGIGGTQAGVKTPNATDPKTSAAAASSNSAVAGDQVQLSSTATALLQGAPGGDFDRAKVDRIREAIASGQFTINAEAIADKLIANAQELLSHSQAR